MVPACTRTWTTYKSNCKQALGRSHRVSRDASYHLDLTVLLAVSATLLDDLRELMVGVEDDGELDEIQLTDDLDRWFSDHFRVHDAKLHREDTDQG